MSFLQIFLLSVGLAMDAAAVATARGCAAGRSSRPGEVARVALLFGGAQALMPVLGWALGSRVGQSMAAVDHWVAFGVLALIGGKMLLDARKDEADDESVAPGFGWRMLCGLALATSIDAFAVGLTLPLLDAPFALSIVTIGVVTAVLSALGVLAGQRFGKLLGSKLDVVGGAVLILLGVKILVEHLAAEG
ncbi:MAG: yebN [Myxococcaceae bacterium]|nr:yebN [Myxococcaceae bacterium]